MIKIKKFTILFMAILLVLCSSFVGCDSKCNPEDVEYEMRLKIGYSGIQEEDLILLSTLDRYDEAYKVPQFKAPFIGHFTQFFVKEFQLINHPVYGDVWLDKGIRDLCEIYVTKIISLDPFMTGGGTRVTEKGIYIVRVYCPEKIYDKPGKYDHIKPFSYVQFIIEFT